MKISLDVRFSPDGGTRAMRFDSSCTADDMVRQIVSASGLAARDDYVLYLPPTESAQGKWLASGETLERLQGELKSSVGAVELHRSPLPLLVHLSQEGDMSQELVQNSVHFTKRVVADLSSPIADAVRDWRVLFSPLTRQRRAEEYTVRLWRGAATTSERAEGLILGHSFWEQGVVPNDILVLYPVSVLRSATVKSALSAALFSGWLLKSAIKNLTGMTLRKTSTLRQSSKKPYFFVLRASSLYCFKSDGRTERVHKIILLDHYRFAKVPMEGSKGFALRLDQKGGGFAPMTPVYLLHTQVEADIDGWYRTIAMVQRVPASVFGVSLHRVCNRSRNFHQYCPDALAALVDELKKRIVSDRERWRCLAVAGAKPPPELAKGLTSEKLPVLSTHADTACAAALRAYLVALPEPLLKPELFSLLESAYAGDDVALAASALQSVDDRVVRHCVRLVLDLLRLVPVEQLAPVCELFGPSLVSGDTDALQARAVLVWVLSTPKVFDASHAKLDLSRLMRRSFKQRQAQLAAEPAPEVVDPEGPSSPPTRRMPPSHAPTLPEEVLMTVVRRHDARNGRELTVEIGEKLRVVPAGSLAGMMQATRLNDSGTSGLVPSSCLVLRVGGNQSSGVSALLSPRSESTAEERLFSRYELFERMAIESIQEERRAKQTLESMLVTLEQLSNSGKKLNF